MIHVSYQTKGPKESCPLICTATQRFIAKYNLFKVPHACFWHEGWTGTSNEFSKMGLPVIIVVTKHTANSYFAWCTRTMIGLSQNLFQNATYTFISEIGKVEMILSKPSIYFYILCRPKKLIKFIERVDISGNVISQICFWLRRRDKQVRLYQPVA